MQLAHLSALGAHDVDIQFSIRDAAIKSAFRWNWWWIECEKLILQLTAQPAYLGWNTLSTRSEELIILQSVTCVLTDTCRGCAAQRVATRDEMVKTRRLSCVTTSVSFREPLDALKLKSQSGMCTSRLSVPSKCQECSSTAELKQSGQPWRRRFRADGYYGFPLYTCDGV